MATTGLLSSLLLAALGVTAATFALYDHFAPQSTNAQVSTSATVAAPSLPPAVRSRTRFVLLDVRPVADAGADANAKGVKSRAKMNAKDKQRPQPQAQKTALPWPWNLLQ